MTTARSPGCSMNCDYRTCRQGGWSDCWMLSALVALGHHRPEKLAAMVNPIGDGSFDVALPGKPTVNVRPEAGGGTASEGGWAGAIEASALQFTNVGADRVLSF